MTQTCRQHFYPTRNVNCFWCNQPYPVFNGKWPRGTWFQKRLMKVRIDNARLEYYGRPTLIVNRRKEST